VLIRALEPVAGIPLMRRRRAGGGARTVDGLARGPGNVCRAMGIDRRANGVDLTIGPVVLLDAPRLRAADVITSPRIGVAYAGPDALLPWRFSVRGSRAISRPPRSSIGALSRA
jgi:DNA-3-methyladenine glycosylase